MASDHGCLQRSVSGSSCSTAVWPQTQLRHCRQSPKPHVKFPGWQFYCRTLQKAIALLCEENKMIERMVQQSVLSSVAIRRLFQHGFTLQIKKSPEKKCIFFCHYPDENTCHRKRKLYIDLLTQFFLLPFLDLFPLSHM